MRASGDAGLTGGHIVKHRKSLLLRGDVEALLPGFDVIALTSRREGLPLALLEGMAYGLPAVASAVGGIPDLLADGGGLTVPARDPQSLADALGHMADDPTLLESEGRRARQIVLERYSRASMVERYVEIYRSLKRFD